MLAPPLFAFSIVAFAALRSDYSHLNDAVSELGARGAPNALAWNLIGFLTVGLLITVFSWGLYRGTGSLAALISVGLSGLGFAGTGMFPADMDDLASPSSRRAHPDVADLVRGVRAGRVHSLLALPQAAGVGIASESGRGSWVCWRS